MKALEGRIGIVTGGSSGIGYAISNVLAAAGATVYAVKPYRKSKGRNACQRAGVIHVQGDVTNDARMREIVEQASGKQSLDFLVNNAGITKNAGPRISQQRILHISCR